MKAWNQLFARHGWLIREVEEQIFNCVNESEGNMQFLMETLELLGVEFEQKAKVQSPSNCTTISGG